MHRREASPCPPRFWALTSGPTRLAEPGNRQAKARAEQSQEQSRNVVCFQWLSASSYPSYCGFKNERRWYPVGGPFEVRLGDRGL